VIIKTSLMAQAAFMTLEGEIKFMEAAAVRGDNAAVEMHRAKVHDYLEAYLDLKLQAVRCAINASG
jgi:hypothetical protein